MKLSSGGFTFLDTHLIYDSCTYSSVYLFIPSLQWKITETVCVVWPVGIRSGFLVVGGMFVAF